MDYNKTLNLPTTDFPMRAGLPKREPEMLADWESLGLYEEILKKNDTSEQDLEIKIKAYQKAGEAFFKEMTEGLSEKEIELVKSNLKNIEAVTE